MKERFNPFRGKALRTGRFRGILENTLARKNRSSPTALQRRQQAQQALDMRLEGKSYVKIADALAYSGPGAVYNAVQRLMDAHEVESIDELRRVECARMDEMLAGLWPAATTGNKDAVEAVVKIQTRRAKLLGLDKPQRVDVRVELRRILLLKIGNRPPRLIDLDEIDLDNLTDEELILIRDMPPTLEAEYKLLMEGERSNARSAEPATANP